MQIALLCIKCLDKLQKQQVINDIVHTEKLKDDEVRELAWDNIKKTW